MDDESDDHVRFLVLNHNDSVSDSVDSLKSISTARTLFMSLLSPFFLISDYLSGPSLVSCLGSVKEAVQERWLVGYPY